MPTRTPVTIHCATCGGQNIGRDSWANWNVRRQEWEAGPLFDHAYCFDCDAETRLEERVLQPSD
jgi:hypothetical protein